MTYYLLDTGTTTSSGVCVCWKDLPFIYQREIDGFVQRIIGTNYGPEHFWISKFDGNLKFLLISGKIFIFVKMFWNIQNFVLKKYLTQLVSSDLIFLNPFRMFPISVISVKYEKVAHGRTRSMLQYPHRPTYILVTFKFDGNGTSISDCTEVAYHWFDVPILWSKFYDFSDDCKALCNDPSKRTPSAECPF